MAIFVTIVAILLFTFLPPIWQTPEPLKNVKLPMAYIFGSFCSALASYLGLNVVTRANASSISDTFRSNFIYIAGSDLIPELRKEEPEPLKSVMQLTALVLGVLILFSLVLLE